MRARPVAGARPPERGGHPHHRVRCAASADVRRHAAPAHPVADSDDELVQQLQHIAAHHGHSKRPFSAAQPTLNMRLPDGSRLAAMRDVVPRPTVTFRRHRLVDVTLDGLVRGGMLSVGMAAFLQAAVRARRSLLVTGNPAVGKTTLLRALAREITAHERVATIETEFELDLHRLPNPGPLLIAMEAGVDGGRPGDRASCWGDVAFGFAAPDPANVGDGGDRGRGPWGRGAADA